MKAKKLFKSKKFINFVCGAVVVVVIAALYIFGVRSAVTRDATFVVARGDTVSGVATRLQSRDLIDSVALFKIAVRGNGGGIQSGQYDIPRGTSVWRIADMLAHGDVAATTIVVPEGLTVKQIKELLLANDDLTGDVECGAGTDLPVCNLHDGDLFPDTNNLLRVCVRCLIIKRVV